MHTQNWNPIRENFKSENSIWVNKIRSIPSQSIIISWWELCTNKTLRRRYLPTTIPICSIQIYICSAWLLTMGAQCSRILALLSSLVIQLKLSADMALRVPSYLSINQVKMTIQDNRKQHISKRKTLYGKQIFRNGFFSFINSTMTCKQIFTWEPPLDAQRKISE